MTDATPPTDAGWSNLPTAPPMVRPGMITGAGVTLIVLGVLTSLLGLLALLRVGLFAGAAVMPGMGLMAAFTGGIFFVALIVVAYGALQLYTGLNVLKGRSWARVTGIVLGIIGAVLALGGLAEPQSSDTIISLALLVTNTFVVYALAAMPRWFSR